MTFLRTCEGNLWENILGCIIEDDVLAGVAVLVAKSPYCYSEEGDFAIMARMFLYRTEVLISSFMIQQFQKTDFVRKN